MRYTAEVLREGSRQIPYLSGRYLTLSNNLIRQIVTGEIHCLHPVEGIYHNEKSQHVLILEYIFQRIPFFTFLPQKHIQV